MNTGSDMNERFPPSDCADVVDRLPLLVLGSLEPGEAGQLDVHLMECATCTAERRLLQRILRARVEPPAALPGRILAEWDRRAAAPAPVPRTAKGHSGGFLWGLPAAAAVVLALGIGSFWSGGAAPESEWSLGIEPQVSMAWFGNEWMVAGQPVLDALPDDVLRSLLEELER